MAHDMKETESKMTDDSKRKDSPSDVEFQTNQTAVSFLVVIVGLCVSVLLVALVSWKFIADMLWPY